VAKDHLGQEVTIGDYIIGAFGRSSSVEIRFGRIVEQFPGTCWNYDTRTHDAVPDAKVKVAWFDPDARTWHISNGRVETYHRRFVKVDLPDHVPPFA
jgi:hypothetical protein